MGLVDLPRWLRRDQEGNLLLTAPSCKRIRTRRAYLEKRLGEIQRQLFRSLGGEFAFEGV